MALTRSPQLSSGSQSWLGAVDVGYLTEAERDSILEVLWRDEKIRKAEQERISKLKTELRDVRRKGAKRAEGSYSNRVCARCNNKTGLIFNTAVQCPVCKHKVCQECREWDIFGHNWKCVVCYKEAKLKAETGEWFYGMMRPELKSMQDGTTLVKQAVTSKPIHFDQQSQSSENPLNTHAVVCNPASSNSYVSSMKDIASISSLDTEGTGSSTESHKHKSKRGKYGPAETGSIGSLRSRTLPLRHNVSDASGSSISSATDHHQDVRRNTLPPAGPAKPPRFQINPTSKAGVIVTASQVDGRIQDRASHEGAHNVFMRHTAQSSKSGSQGDEEDRVSDSGSFSSGESKSIDGFVAEYMQSQKPDGLASTHKEKKQQNLDTKGSYHSYQEDLYNSDKESRQDKYEGETEDQLTQLPSTHNTLPRKINEKLLRQKQLSVSVPAIYSPKNSKKSKPSKMDAHSNEDNASVEYPLSLNRDLSTSVPNLRDSTTSLNSMHLHDLSITGEIRFSLTFNYKTNILLVNVVDCRNLATADRKRKRSDPYVKCYLLPDRKNKQKTDVKKRTICPTYNKCLKFNVNHSELSVRILELSVWHAGTFTRNIFLGQVQLPLDTWDWESKNQNWFPLRQRETINADFVRGTMYKGDLIAGLKYIPPGNLPPGKHKPPYGELNVLIKQAKNLTPVRSNGTADAYVKIMLHPDKQFRQKTSVIPKTSCPEWNYNIRMQLYQPMQDSGLQLTIWHRDKFQGSTFLGGCRLNLGNLDKGKWMDASGMEQNLWRSAISSPNQWVDGSMALRPSM